MSQSGSLQDGSVLSGIETLTGNSGGAVPGTGSPVNINVVGGTGVDVVGNPGTSTLTINLTGGGIAIDSLIPNSGTSPVVPSALGVVTLQGAGSITTVGGLNSITPQLTGLTNHNVLLGAGTTTITNLAPSATSGVPLISQGAAADPAFGTAVVAGGGTGVVTMTTAYAPVCAGTTATGALQVASTGLPTSGFVLTSTGAASLPTFQTVSAAGALTQLDGNSGSAMPTAGVITVTTGASNTQGTSKFTGAGSILTQTFSDASSNIGLGSGSLDDAALSGTNNVAYGLDTLTANTSGSNNVCVGYKSGDAITTGSSCIAIGTNAVGANSTTDSLIGIGHSALTLATGVENMGIGAATLGLLTTGTSNTAVGYISMAINTGSENTAVGARTLVSNTTGTRATALGYRALNSSTADDNTGIGHQAADAVSSGARNTALGSAALGAQTTSSDATAVGYNALLLNTAAQNTAVGSGAGASITAGTGLCAVGYNALNLATGNSNTALGSTAADAVTSGTQNTAVGFNSLGAQTTNSNCAAVGFNSLAVCTGGGNTAVGSGAGASITSGVGLVAVGYNALTLATGNNNVALGSTAGDAITSGADNVCIGLGAVGSVSTTSFNVGIGTGALASCTGTGNVAVGFSSISGATAADSNTGCGTNTLQSIGTGTNNSALGYNAGISLTTTDSNNIMIGANVSGVAGESNTMRLGPSSITTTYINGTIYSKTNAIGGSALVANTGGAAFANSACVYATGYGAGIGYGIVCQQVNDSNGLVIQDYRNTAGGNIGSITYNSGTGGVNYNITSDYRIKKNVTEATSLLDVVSSINIKKYNVEGSETKIYGVLAHELQQTEMSYAVTGEKDKKNSNGDPVYQGVDYSKLVPILVGAIQELKKEIILLKAAK